MAKRKTPEPRQFKRKAAFRKPEKEIIVITEGKNTEPEYIKAFARDNKHPLVKCTIIPEKGVPISIVNEAIAEKKRLKKSAQKSRNSFDELYEIWCVFDEDEHPNLKNALQTARDNDISYILSSPCFELWGCLHYSQNDAPIHRHEMQKKLSGMMPDYDHKNKAIFNYEHMKRNYSEAVARAKELIKRRNEEGAPESNPSTNMYELTESIKKTDRLK